MVTSLRGSILIITLTGLVVIGRGLVKGEPGSVGAGFLFFAIAAWLFFGDWGLTYWFPTVRKWWHDRRRH
ncbi:MAG: hypothetical protein JWP74_533 [Marmoricola sp.]|nr:hypothetical protein [Marmoricola sp.]